MEDIIFKLIEYGVLGIVCGYFMWQNKEKDTLIKDLIDARNEQGTRLGQKIDSLLKDHIEDLKKESEKREALLRELGRRDS